LSTARSRTEQDGAARVSGEGSKLEKRCFGLPYQPPTEGTHLREGLLRIGFV